MNEKRRIKAHGEDLGGTTIRSRFERIDEQRIEHKRMLQMRGSEPMEDPEVTGSKIAHVGLNGAPNVFRETPGGRRNTRGQRGGTM